MYIKSIKIKEGFNESYDEFSPQRTLITSIDNSIGKTTFLRLILHSLGFKIPNTHGIDFDRIETMITLFNDGFDIIIERFNSILKVNYKDENITFAIPFEHDIFLKKILGLNNDNLINNLLGVIYVDQEKGWTLLNRGMVIGKNRFNISEFLAGLGNVDCGELTQTIKKIEFDIKRAATLLDLNDVKNEMEAENGEIAFSDYEKKLNEKISIIDYEIKKTKARIKEIEDVIVQNDKFNSYIDSLKLMIINPNGGEPIMVNRENLIYSEDNIKYLNMRKLFLNIDLEKKQKKINLLKVELKTYNNHRNEISNLFNDNDESEILIQKSISNMNISVDDVSILLEEYRSKLKFYKEILKEKIQSESSIITRIYTNVYNYCKELGIENKISKRKEFLFTDNLRQYSGTILHKLVMAFKLAFHKEIENILGFSIPLIMDSPKGREVKTENAKKILDLIHKELPNSQLIISSIEGFEAEKVILIRNQAIEER